MKEYLALLDREAELKKELRTAEAALDKRLYDFYPTLTEEQVKELVLEDKWMAGLQ